MTKRTALYIRVSSDQQVKEGDSLPAQRDALEKYVKDHAYLVAAGTYMDDGVSGRKFAQRDELQRLLDDVRAGKIDLIIFTKLDRWFRSVRHYTATQEILDAHGVEWIAIWEPIYDTTTPAGRLIVNQMMSIAQYEAENTGQRIRQVNAYKVKQGEVLSGQTPPGYKIVDKHLVPDEHAPDVLAVFEQYAKTGSLRDTMRYARAITDCFPSVPASFKRHLQNRLYIGWYRNNPHYCPAIVPVDLFNDVQHKLSMNIKQNAKRTYIFSGLIRCAECGCNFAGNHRYRQRKATHARASVYQYRCPSYWQRAGLHVCDNSKVITEAALERYLLDNLRPMLHEYQLQIEAEAAPRRDNAAQIAALERKIGKLKDLYINELITLDEYRSDKESYIKQIESLHAAASDEYGVGNLDLSALQEIISADIDVIYAGMSREEKRIFWRSIIREIRFGKDRCIDVIFL